MEEIKEAVAETLVEKAKRVSEQVNAILEAEGMKLSINQVINVIPKNE